MKGGQLPQYLSRAKSAKPLRVSAFADCARLSALFEEMTTTKSIIDFWVADYARSELSIFRIHIQLFYTGLQPPRISRIFMYNT